MPLKLSNNWATSLFILSYHALLILALPIYLYFFTPSWGLLATTAILVYLTGLSITVGYHRLYSHLTYKTNRAVELVLLFLGTLATQGSALRWAFDHRYHHAFIDTEDDPYSIKKGFWYAHFTWMFEKPRQIENKVVSDLIRNPLINFQHRYYGLLMIASNALVFLFVGWFFQDYFGAFVFAWLLRTFILHHMTWFINSLAHVWGSRVFCKEFSAVDNYVISLLTFGEGYHNYHHTFAHDYRTGIKWYHFDPSKWTIWTLHKLGLATKLRKIPHHFIEEKLLLDQKFQLLQKVGPTCKEKWEEKVTLLCEKMLEKLRQLGQLNGHYQTLKKKTEKKEHLSEVREQIKSLKKNLRDEYLLWKNLSRSMLNE